MKFEIEVQDVDESGNLVGTPHVEEYNEDTQDAEGWSKKLVDRFNGDLRPHENPRKILRVTIIDEGNDLHLWNKDITRMSVMDHLGSYDGMRCERCGITGKRFGLGPHVKIDSKYKAKRFQTCAGIQH